MSVFTIIETDALGISNRSVVSFNIYGNPIIKKNVRIQNPDN